MIFFTVNYSSKAVKLISKKEKPLPLITGCQTKKTYETNRQTNYQISEKL